MDDNKEGNQNTSESELESDQTSEEEKETQEIRKRRTRKPQKLDLNRDLDPRPREAGDEVDELDDSGGDSKQVRRKPKRRKQKAEEKDENFNSRRFLLFLMLSPTIIYFLSVSSDIFSRLSFTGKANHAIALVVGAGSVTLISIYYKPIRPLLKYLAVPCLLIFFIPSFQVYRCSPVEVNNSDVGTLVRLNTLADKFLEDAYTSSPCWKAQTFKTPFKLSLYSPSIKLSVKTYHIINLNIYHQSSKSSPDPTGEDIPAQQLPYKLYLFTSQRSVKKQIYYLSLLVRVSSKMTIIDEILKMDSKEKGNITVEATGKIEDLAKEFIPTRKELQRMNYLVRPLMFRVKNIEIVNLSDDEPSDEKSEHSDGKGT